LYRGVGVPGTGRGFGTEGDRNPVAPGLPDAGRSRSTVVDAYNSAPILTIVLDTGQTL